MLNIILYILIGSGIGTFIFLIYKKWSQIQKEDSSSIKFCSDSIKKTSRQLIAYFKQIFIKCRQLKVRNALSKIKKIRVINIAKFFKKARIHSFFTLVKKLEIKAKNRLSIINNSLKKMLQKMAKTVKKVKFPKASKAKPLFEAKFLEREEASSEITDNKENENFFSSTASKIRKNIDKIKIHKIPVFIRKLRKKIRIKSIAIFLKGLRKKVKIRFISEEDQKIKKQLSKTKELIINSESYLGELLKKKKEEDRIISREAESVSFENDVTKGFSNEPIKKNGGIAKLTKLLKKLKKLMTIKNKVIKIVKGMNIRKTEKRESRNIKEEGKFFTKEKIIEKTRTTQNNKQSSAPPKFEISQEAVKKIENKLISEILEDSKNIEAYKRLGKVYYNQDKYHYAAECFKAAIKLGSGDRKIDNLLKECEKKISLPR